MELKEKILFVYPTLLKEGMLAGRPYPPEPLITGMSATKANTIIVTAAIALLVTSNTFISVDVYFNGELTTQDTESIDGYQEVMESVFISDDALVTTTAMHVKNIFFPEPGVYEIRTKLMELDGLNNKIQIDALSCFITVILGKEE